MSEHLSFEMKSIIPHGLINYALAMQSTLKVFRNNLK